MIKIAIATALLTTGLAASAAQAGQRHTYTDADRAYLSDFEQAPAREPVQAPRQQQYYQGGFGSFSAAGTAKTLGY